MSYLKSKRFLISTVTALFFFSLLGCGGQKSVTPDPYKPEDYTDAKLDVPAAPYDEEAKTVENELSMVFWMSEDDLYFLMDDIDIWVYMVSGDGGGRKIMYKKDPIPEALFRTVLVFDEASATIYAQGEIWYEETMEFIYNVDQQKITINGNEVALDWFEVSSEYGPPTIYNFALTAAEIGTLNNFGETERSVVANYDFESVSDDAVVAEPINDNNATLEGAAAVVEGTNNHILVLSQNKDYAGVSHSDTLSFSEAMSATMWVYPVFNSNQQKALIDKGEAQSNYEIDIYRGELIFTYFDGTTLQNVSLSSDGMEIPYETWSHIGITVSPEGIAFYLNGEKKDEAALAIDLEANSDALLIGRNSADESGMNFLGGMDDIKLFNAMLTSEEIKSVYDVKEIK